MIVPLPVNNSTVNLPSLPTRISATFNSLDAHLDLNTDLHPGKHGQSYYDLQTSPLSSEPRPSFTCPHLSTSLPSSPSELATFGMSYSADDIDVRAFRQERLEDRRTKSSKLPKILRDLDKLDPLLNLDPPDQGAQRNFDGTVPAPCILFAGASAQIKWQPADARVDRPGAHLTFKVSGGVLVKQFTISAKVKGSNVTKLCQSQLRFFLGARRQIRDFSHTSRKPEEAESFFGRPGAVHDISWTTCGGFGMGLEVASDYSKEAADVFRALKGVICDNVNGETVIHLVVADVPGLAEELISIQSEIIEYKIPWWPYLDSQGRPRCSWAAFPLRAQVRVDSCGLVPIPAQNSFTTIEEAHVMLANGIYLEYRSTPKHDPGGSWPGTKQSQAYLKTQLVALNNLSAGGGLERWWPIILNQAVFDLPLYDPLTDTEISAAIANNIWSAMEKACPWDGNQKGAIWSSRKLRGRVGVIEGGPGSGKTTSLAAIAVSYASAGCPVLLFAPTVLQAKALTEAVIKVRNWFESRASDENIKAVVSCLTVFKLYTGEADLEDVTENPHDYRENVEDADIIIALPYAICSEALVKNFGKKSTKFLIIHDDAHQLTESEIWGTVLSLAHKEKCGGLIMATDIKEWPLDISTLAPLEQRCVIKAHGHQKLNFNWMYSTWYKCEHENRQPPDVIKPESACKLVWVGGDNEFAEQTGLTLVSRLLRQGLPSVMLKGQYRLRQPLASQVNALVYKANPLASVPNARRSPDMDQFHNLLREWLGTPASNKDMSVIFLEASEGRGHCIKGYGTTESKRNHRNVDVVYDLVVKNACAKAVKVDDIKIVTQLKDQVRLYELEYRNRAKESGITERSLPQVLTLDLLRGHHARVIIYDLVVTCGDEAHGLGIHNSEFRTSLAATRACDTLIIVGSHELLTKFPEFWKWKNRRTGTVNEPLPMIVRYAEQLNAAGLSFNPPTDQRERCDFPTKREWHRPEAGFMPWEWSKNNRQGKRECSWRLLSRKSTKEKKRGRIKLYSN